jgi:CDP-diacylglycerol--glycerol-3-phosphate 3-phosphatidyltransferase
VRDFKLRFREGVRPIARLLVRLGVSANALTVTGLALNLLAGGLVAIGWLTVGGALFLLVNALDFLDGAVARESGTAGPFGAFFDSVLDRPSDAAPLVGLIYYYAEQREPALAVLSAAAIVFSFLVSYARARAEGLGLSCEVGWLQRPERTVLLGAALVLAGVQVWVLPSALAVLAVVSAITSLQRIVHVARLTLGER